MTATAEHLCCRFSLAEIRLATDDFSDAHLIGTGGFGKVYKGLIENVQEAVAIKRLTPNSNQGENEFLTEIETLSKLRHVNLVSLIGYCSENGEMILVYEYIACGTLADHLYKSSGDDGDCLSLTWKQRLKTCVGAAQGLEYLHTSSSIIHRDVKSTNILLDENFTAKVSDFGLAKHLSSSNSKSYVSTIVKGSFGYLDPSYFTTGRVTKKSDTYAFGVVLLEILCGRAAVDPQVSEDDMSLVTWAQEKISKGKLDQIVASNLREEISADCLKTFVGVAKRCLHLEPKKRPTMVQVVVQLELALEQQDRMYQLSRFLPLSSFWNRVKLYGNRATGSAEDIHVNELSTATDEDALKDKETLDMLPIAIPLHELKDITNNFSSHCLLGGRSIGSVYRGVLRSGQVAAIKRLQYRSLEEEEFLRRVSMLSNLRHKNVTQLLGYCFSDRQQFLAYEFAQKGSLCNVLHSAEPVLSWSQRVEIAVGAAKGLEYIHQKGLIHRKIRSRNILVFDNEVTKIVTCDLARQFSFEDRADYCDSYPSVFCNYNSAPRGYAWRTDVKRFGVVLLQLLTGCEDYTRQTGNLVTWATPYISENRVKEIVDPRLEGDYPPKAVAKMATIAALCVHPEAKYRPKMSIVVRDLHRLSGADSVFSFLFLKW